MIAYSSCIAHGIEMNSLIESAELAEISTQANPDLRATPDQPRPVERPFRLDYTFTGACR